ncbi:MAG: hypothetical protein UZ17_ACD001001310 [Acidobacteria bacterium OLB17]|nr:MAG: hypothetical protein UZ17_ACD001001310 [Acidobacteria bacterium OLB17]MCZ2391705.1 hypothetical protein [Acidobacteriota bacterium]
MGIFDRLFKAHKEVDTRRERLLATGRITDGEILELRKDANSEIVAVYRYVLNGVEFESAEVLTEGQLRDSIRYAPGSSVAIRYDPKNQVNSIIE